MAISKLKTVLPLKIIFKLKYADDTC